MILRKYLRLRGIKLYFFANKLGITRNSLHRYMKGFQPVPKNIKLAVLQLTDGKVTKIEDEIKKINIQIK